MSRRTGLCLIWVNNVTNDGATVVFYDLSSDEMQHIVLLGGLQQHHTNHFLRGRPAFFLENCHCILAEPLLFRM